MSGRRVAIVVNPKAGRGDGLEIANRCAEARSGLGDRCEIRITERSRHAIELARDSVADIVVVIGGDGTLREVAAGLGQRRAEVPVVFVPKGHGNVVAREFAIPLDDSAAALSALDSSRLAELDVGIVNGHAFLAMVGVGFDAIATRFVDHARRTVLGRRIYDAPFGGDLLYGIGGTAGLFRFFPTRFHCAIDGEPFVANAPTITVCNTRTYAKGWAIAKDARPDDGLFDVVAQRWCFAPWQLLALLCAKRRARMPDFLARFGRGVRVEIASTTAFTWQLDGDPMPETVRLDIRFEAPSLRLLLPAARSTSPD